MSEFKGTHGPWFWENGVLCNKDFIVGGGGHTFQNQANKNLIAAAPEPLEALQAVVRVADRSTDEFNMARAAIAKALGQ